MFFVLSTDLRTLELGGLLSTSPPIVPILTGQQKCSESLRRLLCSGSTWMESDHRTYCLHRVCPHMTINKTLKRKKKKWCCETRVGQSATLFWYPKSNSESTSKSTWVHWSPMIELLVMTKLRGGTQLSQSGVGFGVSIKFWSSLGLDGGLALPFMAIVSDHIW